MAVQTRLYTADDLANMPDHGKTYELHNGVLIEVAGSKRRQTRLAAWIIYLITKFIVENNLRGEVSGADGTYVLGRYNTRIPDVAYVTAETADNQPAEDEFYRGAPDLAVEVVSESNTPTEMQQRAGEYISAGSRIVWIVDPKNRTVDVYKPDADIQTLSGNAVVDGGDVLPGFNITVAELFQVLDETSNK
jgi:Uma2 family endonuclease